MNDLSIDNDSLIRQYVLDQIAAGESGGLGYNALYGGSTFSDMADHPRSRFDLGNGTYTTAAGRYQFIAPTWDMEASKLGLSDFSPANQDLAAWDLAQRTYKEATGRELYDDAKSKSVDWSVLGSQWTSLAKGAKTGSQDEASTADAGGDVPKLSSVEKSAGASSDLGGLLSAMKHKYVFTPVDYDPWEIQDKMTASEKGA